MTTTTTTTSIHIKSQMNSYSARIMGSNFCVWVYYSWLNEYYLMHVAGTFQSYSHSQTIFEPPQCSYCRNPNISNSVSMENAIIICKMNFTFFFAHSCKISKPSRSLAQIIYSDKKWIEWIYLFFFLFFLFCYRKMPSAFIYLFKQQNQIFTFYSVFIFMCVLWLDDEYNNNLSLVISFERYLFKW